MATISLNQQIDEIDREIKMRERVYPHMASSGKERQSVLDYQMARIKAVKATLELFQEYEPEVRAALEAAIAKKKKGAAA
jgi:lipid II:glycine glycyltransferase (peptidoglycan interpeptide bridge formation enzyme)